MNSGGIESLLISKIIRRRWGWR